MAEQQEQVGELPWWEQQALSRKNTTNSGLKVHTPDPTKYHNISDERVAGRMGMGVTNATMIPRAESGNGGASRGFNATKPNIICVDPGQPGGGFLVDPAKLASKDAAIRRVISDTGPVGSQDDDAQQNMQSIYSQLAAAGATVTIKNARAMGKSTEMSGGTAAASRQSAAPPPRQALRQAVQPLLDAPAPGYPDPSAAARPTAASDRPLDGNGQLNGQLLAQMQQLMAAMTTANTAAKRTEPEETVPVVTVIPEDLEMPFLTAQPSRPLARVIFDMGSHGTMATRYHLVVEGRGSLVLVYDTRYEGDLYLPPLSAPNAPLLIHLAQAGGKTRPVQAISLGLQFTIGCLDCVMLLLPPDPEPKHVVQEAIENGENLEPEQF